MLPITTAASTSSVSLGDESPSTVSSRLKGLR